MSDITIQGYGNVVGDNNVVRVIVRGEDVRDKELAYLSGLVNQYERWRERYTPLEGIAEVREAVSSGSLFDHADPFIPPEFEKLVEHGFGPRTEVRREPVDDLRAAVQEHRRIILLGDPGSGKTTTLWRLTYDYAAAAQENPRAPLPVFVRLGEYVADEPFRDFLRRHLGPLAAYLESYRASGRLILLLDGLNEMPHVGYAERVGRIQAELDRYADEIVAVTCRPLDYGAIKLKRLQKIEVAALDEARIRTFLHNYLGEVAGERLFWRMAGGDALREVWQAWRSAGGEWDAFWTAEEMPGDVYAQTTSAQDRVWRTLRTDYPPLLAMGRNPYLLRMTIEVYVRAREQIPTNRARVFRAFVDVLLAREEKRHPERWIAANHQEEALAGLAYAMQAERGQGTTVERSWAKARVQQTAPQRDPERILYLATSATLLDGDETTVRFYHQLLQEYFAAREMKRRAEEGEAFAHYWPPDRWWEPSGWEETGILMVGMAANAGALVRRLAKANPLMAARCLLEGDPDVDEAVRGFVVDKLIATIRDESVPPETRVEAGKALAKLGDPRPGVGLDGAGLPDIAWCAVPAGPFVMGSRAEDELAYDDEKPQHTYVMEQPYTISRYPITNAQFAAFVRAGGYEERTYWTDAGWSWLKRGEVEGPRDYGEPFNLPNHPVVGVSWYEALAFCRWLTLVLSERGDLETGQMVTLPSEAEWEKAARGTGGRTFPWGEEADPNRANYADTGLDTTSTMGCFPGGSSPYGVEDLSGNVWEWTRSLWGSDLMEPEFGYPYDPKDGRENLEAGGNALRVLRGGAFSSYARSVRCACRLRYLPLIDHGNYRFRVVVPPSPSGA